MDCYEILEVSQNASPEVIKAAYKSLMQRFHPDKHPDNPQIAARALQVTQAYEVLSDSDKRAAYDIKLKQQLAISAYDRHRGGEEPDSLVARELLVAKKSQSYGLLWLLIALVIVICLYAISLLGNRSADDMPSSSSGMPGQNASESSEVVRPRTIPVYLSDLNVELGGSGELAGGFSHVLNIPTLGVRVGAFEANKVLRYMDSNKELIRQKLEERLAGANYDELIKLDGEQYLKNIVKDSIGDTTGTNQFNADPLNGEHTGQYGVVDILLPRSFSVH